MSEKFSIVNTLDLRKLQNEIGLFIARNREENPYIFMSKETINAIYEPERFDHIAKECKEKNADRKYFAFGYRTFENNDLKFGEIEIR